MKTGLRVDRVKQVTRVLRSDIEPPPPAIRGATSDYLEGVVKLDKGQRIIMALNAGQVCQIGVGRRQGELTAVHEGETRMERDRTSAAADIRDDILQMVTFRIAREEFAFPMERVREILRVETPKQVPDVPEYVLGVLTVRGQILPIVCLLYTSHLSSQIVRDRQQRGRRNEAHKRQRTEARQHLLSQRKFPLHLNSLIG